MINKVILVGNVGVDPEIRTTESGVKVARVRLATTERIYNRQTNESTDLTEWHTVTLWRGLADVADRYVRKGSQLYIEGRLRTREWTDKDNIKRYSTEILADDMKLLGRRSDNQSAPGGMQGASQPYQQPAQQGGYPQPYQQPAAAPSYGQPSYQQPASPSIPAPQEDPDDLPF
jgi:single-strand DNA-binding protein